MEENPAPVEVGSLSHYLQCFIPPTWLGMGFLPSNRINSCQALRAEFQVFILILGPSVQHCQFMDGRVAAYQNKYMGVSKNRGYPKMDGL